MDEYVLQICAGFPCCVYFQENMNKSTIGTDRFLPSGALNLNLGYFPSLFVEPKYITNEAISTSKI